MIFQNRKLGEGVTINRNAWKIQNPEITSSQSRSGDEICFKQKKKWGKKKIQRLFLDLVCPLNQFRMLETFQGARA